MDHLKRTLKTSQQQVLEICFFIIIITLYCRVVNDNDTNKSMENLVEKLNLIKIYC